MSSHLLGLDVGTTGVTACLLDQELRVVESVQQEFPQHFPQPGWVEHDGEELLATVDAVLAELLAPLSASDYPRAMGLTNQRETVFALDRKTLRPLGRGIVWQDRRTEERCAELRAAGRGEWIHQRTGLLLDPYFSATKIQWMCEQDAQLRDRARRGEVAFGTVDSLVLAHLSGSPQWLSDPTNASRTMLFNLESRAWDPELCELFGVELGSLAEIRPSRSDFGVAQASCMQGRKLPILGVAGDQQAALFGQGCLGAGDLKSTFGTGCFLLLNTGGERVQSGAGLLTTIALGEAGQPVYALEGSVFVAGALVQWLRDNLGLIETSAEIEGLARGVPDSAGVFVIPAFAGLGAPYWDAEARGALLGLTRGSTRAHIARAALEAIAFQNVELVEALRKETGLPILELRADGGVVANDLFMQMQADLAGLRTQRAQSVEATVRGAAALAGLGLGLWKSSLEAGFYGDPLQSFEPLMESQERLRRLGEWRQAVSRVRSR